MAATSAQGERAAAAAAAAIQSSNRRRGWVIASQDGTEVQRPSSFDARKSAAAWNKGKGPSKASIPSRASSLASSPSPSPAASPALLSEPFKPLAADPAPTIHPETVADATPTQPVPPPRVPSSSMSHNRDASSSATSQPQSSTGRRRPSPPLLVPPKQTFRKVPSTRVLPPSALSDHQKFMSAASRSSASASSSSTAGPSGSRSPLVTAALRNDLAKLAASRRANSTSSSSAATTSPADTVIQSATTSATTTSAASSAQSSSQYKGKGKETAQSPLQTDAEGFFSSGGKVKQLVNTYDSGHGRQWSGEKQSTASPSMSSQQGQFDRTQPKLSHLSLTHPPPPLSEKSANSDLDDVLSSASDLPSDSEAANMEVARPAKRRDSLQIELPPPPPQFKDRYPSILVDSTHASDSEASGTSIAGARRRRRRSTASTSHKLGGDADDDEDDDDYADDDSSWPSTPSTTPLEMYFTAADATAAAAAGEAGETRPRAARRTVQTTKEIIAPVPDALGMGRPMVVVTSPSTASEVSSDRTYSSSPPAVASIAPAPALSKIEEHPAAKPDVEAIAPAASKTSLSFEVPDVPRSRASQENLQGAGGAPVRSPCRTRAFLAKISPSRSANRSSVDLASTAQPSMSAEAAKRMSLDSQRRTSGEQRRSVELRPILLNATARPPPARTAAADLASAGAASPNSTAAAQQAAQQQQQQRRSSGRVAIRPNVVPYHSRRSSEVSVGSSTDSHRLRDRGASFDKDAFDPRYSPSSQVTALTMPSPALGTKQNQFPPQQNQPVRAPAVGIDARRSSPTHAPHDRFAASMPSLHEPHRGVAPSPRRCGSHESAESRPSAIRLLVDSQKGRTTRDNDSIAEWISVSVNDLPLPDATHAYGNGGAGEFSNETQQHGKKAKKSRQPWRLGRFAASEVVLPAKESKRRSMALVKRASSSRVNEAGRASCDSAPSTKGPFMRNLGFTTANRNVVLQNLCAERSILALGASTAYIAGSGRINVPQPRRGKAKVKAKQQANKGKKQPIVDKEAPSTSPHASHSAQASSQDAYLNVSEDRHTGYDLSGAAVGTVKSMVPELGDWSGSSGLDDDRGATEDTMAPQPFRDYEDEGSDLFDSERSESESEDEMDYDDDDDDEVEVPVRFGQRVNLANRFSSHVQPSSDTPAAISDTTSAATSGADTMPSQVTPSVSLERLRPGTLMLHKNELRICVEEAEVTGRPARPWAYWKAVEVQPQPPKPQPDEPVVEQHQVRRQLSSRAMKLEQEVATGIFAAFVGNRSPRRQQHAQRSSFDAGSTGGSTDQGSPTKRSAAVVSRELVVSKVNKSMFSVRSETRSTGAGTEQVVEIVRRQGERGSSHVVQPESGSSRASVVPMDKVERAFPWPLLANADFAHIRSRSNRTDGSQSTVDDAVEGTTIRIEQQHGGRGIAASFTTRDGQNWSWTGSKLEASVLSPRNAPSSAHTLDALEGYDLVLRSSNGSHTVELATYSTESQVRNALGLFKPRTPKPAPKPLPEDGSSVGPVAPPPARVLPLAIPLRGAPGPMAQMPMRGIRGGPLVRPPQSGIAGSPRQHALWQHQRAAISNEVVVQVHNNAVDNARASLLLNNHGGAGGARQAGDGKGRAAEAVEPCRASMDEATGIKKMGVLTFSRIEASVDRDLVVLSLLAVMGSVRVL